MYRLEYVAGVDEVGRGPLAGAVFAAAVVLNPFRQLSGLRDSKMLSAKRREVLSETIKEQAVSYCIARADVHEIDQINILQASYLAMKRAIEGLTVPLDFVLVDGNRLPDVSHPAEWIVKGDSKVDAIKAASIIAKVARDHEMQELDKEFPVYGLAQHKGYPTRFHLDALREHGPSPIHRMSFAPCRQHELFGSSSD